MVPSAQTAILTQAVKADRTRALRRLDATAWYVRTEPSRRPPAPALRRALGPRIVRFGTWLIDSGQACAAQRPVGRESFRCA